MSTTKEITHYRFIAETVFGALEVIQSLNEGHYISDLCVHQANDVWAVNVFTNAHRACMEEAMAYGEESLMRQTLREVGPAMHNFDA
jgi:hypothetical protein